MFRIPAKSLHNTIFARLVFTYLVVILPIIMLGVYLYNWSYKNASEEVSRNSQAQLSAYLEDLDREIEWMEIQQYDILQDGELRKIALTWDLIDGVERKESVNYLLHRLTSIKSTSAYIKDIYIHIRSIGKTVSGAGGLYDFDAERYAAVRSEAEVGGRLLKLGDSLNLSGSMYGGNGEDEPLALIQIELDNEKLKESLAQVNVYPESGSFLIAGDSDFILASDDEATPILARYAAAEIEEGRAAKTALLEIDGRTYHFDRSVSDTLELSVVSFLPEETVKRPLNRFNLWAWVFAGTSVFAILIYALSTYQFVHRPLLLLVRSFRRMEGGALDIQIDHARKDEFGYLFDRFNQMLVKLQTLIDQDFKQKLMMQKAELKQLQSQINPHFLYNSFFIMNSLAKTGDTERIELFTNMLGDYFRFITRNGEDNVLLTEEIKHARTYTEIQKLRFSRRIRVQFDDLPSGMAHIRVPRLIVQPIIENAYEHSLEKMTQDGRLLVTFERNEREALVIVEDNGNIGDAEIEALYRRVTDASESHETTGLANIHRRIALTYGEGSGLRFSRGELQGLRVVIRITLGEEHRDV
ncbi:sensor histidine kinase YesM [Paenibacillus cisolokensis]|uniref:Sensor histidine kinase YesM n=1 Tax=Paenibacillus cisolokensis TaxID=1658519 RepID=A0ABQ4N8L2_9BACL|nr:histidine kinase [Paenibacillus cisolokensis]GIQ64505.1 sensor histidine kinase YesM [Paenibacillus cisolokensis]